MRVKANIVANFLGQGWKAVISFAFVPLYVRYLGVEAFGLIGMFALLQAWMAILDMGLRQTLSREMARFTGGATDPNSIRNLLRTIEIFVFSIATCAAFAVWTTSEWFSTQWVNPQLLSLESIATAFVAMGMVIALNFVEGMYLGCLAGLQRQIAQNFLVIATSTARSLGALLVVAFVSPTIQAFFIWQALVSLASITAVASVVYRVLPPGARARPSWTILKSVWRFAAGTMAIALMSLLTTSADKILLSRMLTLENFGHYALATAIAGAIGMLAAPIAAAFGPRFTELVALRDEVGQRAAYHMAAQLITVIAATAVAMILMFADQLMLLWTGDPALVRQVTPLLRVLAIAAFFHMIMQPPYFMQLAHGWTSLSAGINLAALCLITPTLLWVIPKHGTLGAAWVMVCQILLYVSVGIVLMHRRILRGQLGRWYIADVATPSLTAVAAAYACWLVVPRDIDTASSMAILAASSALIFAAAAAGASDIRHRMISFCLLRISDSYTPHGASNARRQM